MLMLIKKGRKKVNGERVALYEMHNGTEVVEQIDARNGKPVLVTLTGARAMRSPVAHYPLDGETEKVLTERFYNQDTPHLTQNAEARRENVRALLRTVVKNVLGLEVGKN